MKQMNVCVTASCLPFAVPTRFALLLRIFTLALATVAFLEMGTPVQVWGGIEGREDISGRGRGEKGVGKMELPPLVVQMVFVHLQ
jgi:hypothetical protein